MSLTSRFGRRLTMGIGLASAAVLLPTAALASSAAVSAQSTSAHAVPACRAAGTRVWFGLPSDSGAGHTFVQMQISNIGHSACTFFGFPGVSALNRHGHQVGLPATHSGRRISVTLQPRDTAHFVLGIVDAGIVCSHPLHATDIRVFPPGQFHSQSVPLASLACKGKSVLSVDSVHAGAGIPGFTNR